MELFRERTNFDTDIDGNQFLRTATAKTLKDVLPLITASNLLDGEVYDGFLGEENPITKFVTIHYFNQGQEQFNIVLGHNVDLDMGALKSVPSILISKLFFAQGLNTGEEPVGSIMGFLFAVGGNNVTFTILRDESGFFEITNGFQITGIIPVPEGEFTLIVKAEGNNTQFIDQITIKVVATSLISNINLSNIIIEDGSPIGTSVGALSTVGGESPIAYSVIFQSLDSIEVDIFEIVNNALVTKDNLDVVGSVYDVFILAEDSRTELPDDERIKVEEFPIEVVVDAFIDSNSLSFGGVDERIDIEAHIGLWGVSNFSGSFWIKPNNKGSNQYIASKFQEAGKRSWAIRVNTAGTIAIVYSQTGVASDTTTTNSELTFGQWHHIAFAFDGTLPQPKMKIWLDGVLDVDEDTALTSLFNNSDVDMFLGALNQPLPTVASDYFDGLIDEASIYNTSLVDADIQDIYNLGIPTNITSLPSGSDIISWWRMGDNFSGTTEPDEVGIHNGTTINMNNSNRSTDIPS